MDYVGSLFECKKMLCMWTLFLHIHLVNHKDWTLFSQKSQLVNVQTRERYNGGWVYTLKFCQICQVFVKISRFLTENIWWRNDPISLNSIPYEILKYLTMPLHGCDCRNYLNFLFTNYLFCHFYCFFILFVGLFRKNTSYILCLFVRLG